MRASRRSRADVLEDLVYPRPEVQGFATHGLGTLRQNTGTSKGQKKKNRPRERDFMGRLQKEWESLQFEKRVVLYHCR